MNHLPARLLLSLKLLELKWSIEGNLHIPFGLLACLLHKGHMGLPYKAANDWQVLPALAHK